MTTRRERLRAAMIAEVDRLIERGEAALDGASESNVKLVLILRVWSDEPEPYAYVAHARFEEENAL